jgi:hypothetical protein
MEDRTTRNLLDAIGVMTAWCSDPKGEHQDSTAAIANESMVGSGGPIELIAGFVTLSGWLLTRIEKLCGATADHTLQDIAIRVHDGQ